jgi:hypothetical protein
VAEIGIEQGAEQNETRRVRVRGELMGASVAQRFDLVPEAAVPLWLHPGAGVGLRAVAQVLQLQQCLHQGFGPRAQRLQHALAPGARPFVRRAGYAQAL